MFLTVSPYSTQEYDLPQSIDLCLVERLTPCHDEIHRTGFRAFNEPATQVYERYVVRSISDIIFPVHIVPDFSTALNHDEDIGIFNKYFENYDVDLTLHNKGTLEQISDTLCNGVRPLRRYIQP